jgi:hypothetical protein
VNRNLEWLQDATVSYSAQLQKLRCLESAMPSSFSPDKAARSREDPPRRKDDLLFGLDHDLLACRQDLDTDRLHLSRVRLLKDRPVDESSRRHDEVLAICVGKVICRGRVSASV